MIKVFKITDGIYNSDVSPQLAYHSESITRGNKHKLLNHRFHYDLRKHYFSARIVNIWNSLPNHVIDVNTVNVFKAPFRDCNPGIPFQSWHFVIEKCQSRDAGIESWD